MGEPNTAYAKYFIGNSYLNPLTDTKQTVPMANVTFEPKCRNNWHIHKADRGGGQIFLCTDGCGWYREWGKPARKLHAGDVVTIPANVKHWHGATADDPLAEKAELLPEDLLGLPVICPMRKEIRQNVRNIMGPVFDKFNIVASFNVVNNATLLVERKLGYLLVIEGATQYHHNPELCFRPIKAAPKMRCLTVWKKYQPSNRAVSRFLEEVAMLVSIMMILSASLTEDTRCAIMIFVVCGI